jgi:hypothetical protein
MSVLVYALSSPSTTRLSTAGIAGERLRRVRVGAIEAIVGSVRTIPQPSEENLRRYDRVLSVLWRRTRTLLPVRFGTLMPDIAALEALLDEQQRPFRRRLQKVRNRAQMTIRIVGTSKPKSQSPNPKGQIPKPNPEIPKSGSEYLRGRARETREVQGFSPVRAAVKRWVRAERVEKRGGVSSVYHLVPYRSVPSYLKALESAARAAALRVVISGPWPPYAFAEDW